jgi:hypothetical protein
MANYTRELELDKGRLAENRKEAALMEGAEGSGQEEEGESDEEYEGPAAAAAAAAPRRLNWQKMFSGAVSLVCWRLRRWVPAARLTYGVQVGWNSGSIRHLVPPQGPFLQQPRN